MISNTIYNLRSPAAAESKLNWRIVIAFVEIFPYHVGGIFVQILSEHLDGKSDTNVEPPVQVVDGAPSELAGVAAEANGGDCGQRDEPEPEEDVDLLVERVERQNAEAVLDFDGSRMAEIVEGALGHLGEDD